MSITIKSTKIGKNQFIAYFIIKPIEENLHPIWRFEGFLPDILYSIVFYTLLSLSSFLWKSLYHINLHSTTLQLAAQIIMRDLKLLLRNVIACMKLYYKAQKEEL